jgi:hypothetical protein
MESTAGDTSMSSARAVCRLMANTNLVDCSTGKSAGPRAFEDAAGIDADLMKHVREIGSVAHQPANCHKFTVRISRWNPVSRRQGGKLAAATGALPHCNNNGWFTSICGHKRERRGVTPKLRPTRLARQVRRILNLPEANHCPPLAATNQVPAGETGFEGLTDQAHSSHQTRPAEGAFDPGISIP